MEHYLLFLMVAAAAVVSPGPGVTLTITNSLRYGIGEALGGILGISLGALFVAVISATGVGLILAASSLAFTVMKYVGAVYLIYLGIKMWRAAPMTFDETPAKGSTAGRCFMEALSLQLSNPKAIFFFVSIFPQFIDRSAGYTTQFFALVLTYSSLVIAIHLMYAMAAGRAKRWFASPRGRRAINRIGGGTLIFFGAALATANK